MNRIGNQRGVAMVTVLFVGAALTAVTSVAALTTIQELRAGREDRKATEALSYAEAGIDRFIQLIRSGRFTYAQLRTAGCNGKPALAIPTGKIGSGSFSAELVPFNPDASVPAGKLPPQTCSPETGGPPLSAHDRNAYFAITATGCAIPTPTCTSNSPTVQPDAKRVIRQVVAVKPLGFPIGIYANRIEGNGTPSIIGASMVSETVITGRKQLEFTGIDPYYKMSDFFSTSGVSGRSMTEQVPSAAHAAQGIFLQSNGSVPEFTGGAEGTKNCGANKSGKPNGTGSTQSLWDSDGSSGSGPITGGCDGQTGFPLSSRFSANDLVTARPKLLDEQDHQLLKEAAKASGLYCSISGSTSSCTLAGAPITASSNWQTGQVSTPLQGQGINNFVAYFDFLTGTPTSNEIRWNADVWSCDAANPDNTKSVVMVVRNGGADLNSNVKVNGAVILDGEIKYTGGATINGTVIADRFNVVGGATFQLDECWVQNMPGPFLDVVPTHWSELDR